MTSPIAERMVDQGLWRPRATSAEDVVGALVGIQAQEFPYALFSIAQRMTVPANRAAMLQAFDDGTFLRTHVLRPTWHFALPADIKWMLRLTAPKLRRLMASYSRQLGLDAAALSASQAVLTEAVAGGRHRTRAELAASLERVGIDTGGLRLGFILMHAEYDEVLISGALRGKQQTYAAFDERVPPGPGYDEDAALAELARRYVATRAPVTAKDLATWASLTLAQARRGLAAIEATCTVRDIDGLTLWSPCHPTKPDSRIEITYPAIDLVQGYDEIVMSYSESRGLLSGGTASLPVLAGTSHLHAVLIDGMLAGHWRHQLSARSAVVQVQLRRPLSRPESAALLAAVGRYGDYLGRPTSMAEPVLLD